MKVPTPHAMLPAGRSAVQGGLKKLILYDPGRSEKEPFRGTDQLLPFFVSHSKQTRFG